MDASTEGESESNDSSSESIQEEGDPTGFELKFLDKYYYLDYTSKEDVEEWVKQRHPPPDANTVTIIRGICEFMRDNGSLLYSDETANEPREVFCLFLLKIENMIRCLPM